MSLDEFLDWYSDGDGRYELVDGLIVEIQPTGQHSKVSGFIDGRFSIEIDRLQLPYFIPEIVWLNPLIPINRAINQM